MRVLDKCRGILSLGLCKELFEFVGPYEMVNSKDPQQLTREQLLEVLTRYEKLRLAGLHDGPPLQGIRLYQLQWTINTRADNIDQPSSKELVAEAEKS
jgi:hypothetical protein